MTMSTRNRVLIGTKAITMVSTGPNQIIGIVPHMSVFPCLPDGYGAEAGFILHVADGHLPPLPFLILLVPSWTGS